jgi:hypothetical protein
MGTISIFAALSSRFRLTLALVELISCSKDAWLVVAAPRASQTRRSPVMKKKAKKEVKKTPKKGK